MNSMLLLSAAVFHTVLIPPLRADQPNPWRDKAPALIAQAEANGDSTAFRAAFDAAYRADDWGAGLRLAHIAQERFAKDSDLLPLRARALWRGGQLVDAERAANSLQTDPDHRDALAILASMRLAAGDLVRAERACGALEKLQPQSAAQWYSVIEVRMASERLEGIANAVRASEKLIDPANGYPETVVGESVEGLAAFFESIGPSPVNEIHKIGRATMPLMAALGLPYVDVMINGNGPHRLIVDTGGSVLLSLDAPIADELKIRSVAPASVRGIGGKQESQQALVSELRIGEIELRRVVTRVFELPPMLRGACDGILGTGMFGKGRMTLDFDAGELIVSRSSAASGAGTESLLRIVGDGKLVVPATANGEVVAALLDSGATTGAVSPSVTRRLFPQDHGKPKAIAGGSVGVGSGESSGMALVPGVKLNIFGRSFDAYGGVSLEMLDKTFSPLLGVQVDVLVGMPTLRQMRSMTVDFRTARIWVDWLPAK